MMGIRLTERIVRMELARLLHREGKGKGAELVKTERLDEVAQAFVANNPGWEEWDINRVAVALRPSVEAW